MLQKDILKLIFLTVKLTSINDSLLGISSVLPNPITITALPPSSRSIDGVGKHAGTKSSPYDFKFSFYKIYVEY